MRKPFLRIMTRYFRNLLILASLFLLLTSCDPNETNKKEYNVFVELNSPSYQNVVIETTPKANNGNSGQPIIDGQVTLTFYEGENVTLFVNLEEAFYLANGDKGTACFDQFLGDIPSTKNPIEFVVSDNFNINVKLFGVLADTCPD